MRDRLNALVVAGAKTATAGLWKVEYEPEGEEPEVVGEQQVILASNDTRVAVVAVTRAESYRFVDVPWEFARAEGEGFTSIEHWRGGHRSYYGEDGITVDDDDLVICTWFKIVTSD